MNIDERLEKLTERHDVLAHGIELPRFNGEQTDRQISEIAIVIAGLASRTDRLGNT